MGDQNPCDWNYLIKKTLLAKHRRDIKKTS